MTTDDRLNLLQSALREPEPQGGPGKAPAVDPGTRPLSFSYRTPDGVLHDHTLIVRLLTFNERHQVESALVRLFNGVRLDAASPDWVEFARAALTLNTMWPDMPAWLRTAVEQDEELTLALYDETEGWRRDYFRGVVQSGGAAPAGPRLVIHPAEPAGDGSGPAAAVAAAAAKR